MTFESIDNLIKAIAKLPTWEKQRQYNQVVECWRKVVNDKIAQNTRPLYIKNQILWIATPNSVWAQNLTLQRYSLIKKLNPFLEQPLNDIRFSPARWYQKHLSDLQSTSTVSDHPSTLPLDLNLDLDFLSPFPDKMTPQEAFLRWANVVKKRAAYLKKCPQCESPTPEGELQRWGICAYCAAKTFS